MGVGGGTKPNQTKTDLIKRPSKKNVKKNYNFLAQPERVTHYLTTSLTHYRRPTLHASAAAIIHTR